jgi:hypothetical protein
MKITLFLWVFTISASTFFFVWHLRSTKAELRAVERAFYQIFHCKDVTPILTPNGNIWLSQLCKCDENHVDKEPCNILKEKTFQYFLKILKKSPCNVLVESCKRESDFICISLVISNSKPVILTFYFTEKNNTFFIERIDNVDKVLCQFPNSSNTIFKLRR